MRKAKHVEEPTQHIFTLHVLIFVMVCTVVAMLIVGVLGLAWFEVLFAGLLVAEYLVLGKFFG